MEKMKGLASRLSDWGPSFIFGSIRGKLMFALFVLAIGPLLTLGVYAYLTSSGSLRENAEKNLIAVSKARARSLQTHIQNRYENMKTLNDTIKAIRSKAFDQLASMQRLKKNLIEGYFRERMSDVNVMSHAPVMINALNAFRNTDSKVGSEKWKQVERRYGPYLVQFSEFYGYYDAYLVSSRGEVLYTVAQESDLGVNLKTGKLKDSPAGKAFARGLKDLVFQDFEPYGPADGAPAAFIAGPVKSDGRTIGALMVQVSVDQINYIMQERTGFGRTGESYLVGPDHLFRSDSIHVAESTIMNPNFKVDVEGIAEGLAGKSGQAVTVNFRGEYVLSSWTPVQVQDRIWVMISEIDVTEAFVPKVEGDEDFLAKFKKNYGFSDVGLMNPDGFLFYTVLKGDDYRTNILKGPYKDSNLGKLLRKVMDKRMVGFADYAAYEPLGNQHAAFIAMPVLSDKGTVEVVAVAQLSTRENNTVMRDRTGMGKTGETYLVGRDRLFRSESRFADSFGVKTAVMNPRVKVTTDAVKNAFSTDASIRTGSDIIRDYRGEKTLTAWMPFSVVEPSQINPRGITWALVAQIDFSEVESPAIIMGLWIAAGCLVVLIGVIVAYVFLTGGITGQIDNIMNLFNEIGIGNFKARAKVVSNDELGEMASSLNAMLDNTLTLIQSTEERDAMQKSIMKLLDEISGLAEGDLTLRAEVTEDFTGAIADSFNAMAEQLGEVVKNVMNTTFQVGGISKDVRQSTEKLAEQSEMQAVQVSDAIAAINEMSASIQQVAESATQSARVSEQSTANAKEGAVAVRNTNASMESIRDHVQETARSIKRLGESSQEIGNIVQLINDIADRTSILALNASIQAAMAGDAGRGFAVVAEEVQRLAERSTNATKQIDTLIKNIQGEINEAGTSMDESIQQVVDGSRLANDAYLKLQEIEKVTIQLGELIQSISMASKQQARASDNIAKTMEEVGEISSQTSAASRQTAVAMKTLSDASEKLNESVSVFKLEKEGNDNT